MVSALLTPKMLHRKSTLGIHNWACQKPENRFFLGLRFSQGGFSGNGHGRTRSAKHKLRTLLFSIVSEFLLWCKCREKLQKKAWTEHDMAKQITVCDPTFCHYFTRRRHMNFLLGAQHRGFRVAAAYDGAWAFSLLSTPKATCSLICLPPMSPNHVVPLHRAITSFPALVLSRRHNEEKRRKGLMGVTRLTTHTKLDINLCFPASSPSLSLFREEQTRLFLNHETLAFCGCNANLLFSPFRQNGPFLAGDKNTVYQKTRFAPPWSLFF